MLKITELAASVNRSKTRDVRRDATRLRQLRRILTLIDIMAPCRLFHATEEIRCHLCERLGENVHQRTLLRDLHLLESLGMAERQAADCCPHSRRFRWRLNLRCSESAQCAAIKFDEAPLVAKAQDSSNQAKEESMASGNGFSVIAFKNDGSDPQRILSAADEETAWRFSRSREDTVVVPDQVAAGLDLGKGLSGLSELNARILQSHINGAIMLKRQEAPPHQFTAAERKQLSNKLARMQALVESGRVATPLDVGMMARELDRFCSRAEGCEPREDAVYCSEHFGIGYGGEHSDDALKFELASEHEVPRKTRQTKIKSLIDQWFGRVVVAHSLGLLDDLHELARLAEACRQFAQNKCEFDPFWEELCFDGDEFMQEEFDHLWRDVSCESSPGKCDAMLGLGAGYSGTVVDRENSEVAAERDLDDCSEWRILTCDAITGDVHRGSMVLTKQEALQHLEHWNSEQEHAIAIPWPAWAPEPVIRVPVED